MKRREFLSTGLGAVTGSLLAPRFGLAQVSPERKKIIVIGAGLSGLTAAYELRKLNNDVAVLEAQSRPGGRVLTLRNFDEPGLYAEAGAARIPRHHDLTLKYVHEFGLPLAPFYPTEGRFARVRRGRVEYVGWEKFEDAVTMVDIDEPDAWHRIAGGNDQLPRAFAKRLADTVRYDSPVVRIEQGLSEAVVRFKEKGTQRAITGDFVICAIPFTTLSKIEVSPAFRPAKSEAIRSLAYDSASRVFIETRKRVWRDRQLNGFAVSEDAGEVWESTFGQPGAHGILQSYLRGDRSMELIKKTESERIETTLERLNDLFPDLRPNFVKGISKCWSEDPWVFGAWAHLDENEARIGMQPEGRIFFAGEHLSDNASWMQGAFQSGLRVVREVVSARITV